MQNTSKEYDAVVQVCQDLFSKKMKDYGCAWRILRLPSLTSTNSLHLSILINLKVFRPTMKI